MMDILEKTVLSCVTVTTMEPVNQRMVNVFVNQAGKEDVVRNVSCHFINKV